MAKRKDVREESCEPTAVADEATPAADTPQVSSAAEAVAAALQIEDTTSESLKLDAKLPPAAQLAESAPAVSPPPFLREHENRAIAARPAAKAAPAKIAASGAKEKSTSRLPLLAATLALAAGLGGAAGGPTPHPKIDFTAWGNTATAETKAKPTIIEEYVVRRVYDGVALVEGRKGIIEVEPGTTLPGAGRVEEIRRQDGRWVVVTNKGLIVPPR